MVERNLDLIFEFEKYILVRPKAAECIPQSAIVVMQVTGDKRFNQWSRRVAQHHVRNGHRVVYVTIKKMGPVRSRIEKLEIGPTVATVSQNEMTGSYKHTGGDFGLFSLRRKR